MKTIYKMAIALLLCVIAVVYLLNSIGTDVSKKLNTEENKYKKHIGKKYIIDKDTLTIVDYSIFSENFTLSDGRKVNYVLIGKD
tara:strand:- start:7 stop:258 length:252 start_codon:yes stop_codon:yes gene_type:complete